MRRKNRGKLDKRKADKKCIQKTQKIKIRLTTEVKEKHE